MIMTFERLMLSLLLVGLPVLNVIALLLLPLTLFATVRRFAARSYPMILRRTSHRSTVKKPLPLLPDGSTAIACESPVAIFWDALFVVVVVVVVFMALLSSLSPCTPRESDSVSSGGLLLLELVDACTFGRSLLEPFCCEVCFSRDASISEGDATSTAPSSSISSSWSSSWSSIPLPSSPVVPTVRVLSVASRASSKPPAVLALLLFLLLLSDIWARILAIFASHTALALRASDR
mmetsp:Transcript_14074/g.29725  ORF Transcript_14074/g.29725 Transcript_14074/m.29725 type:complete len:235 (-) Transcript_14074:2124-2828(-)